MPASQRKAIAPEDGDNGADNGFTLMELLIVVALLALMASLVFTSLRSPNEETALRSSALQVANLMRMARGAAIRDNVERTLTFDLGAGRFWVDGLTNAHENAHENVHENVHEFPKGARVELAAQGAEQLSRRQARLRFFVDGSATGGSVVLAAKRRRATVELNGFTGHVTVRWER